MRKFLIVPLALIVATLAYAGGRPRVTQPPTSASVDGASINPSYISTGGVDAGAYLSTAASGADGFRCLTEGCQFQIGPDTNIAESGTTILSSAAVEAPTFVASSNNGLRFTNAGGAGIFVGLGTTLTNPGGNCNSTSSPTGYSSSISYDGDDHRHILCQNGVARYAKVANNAAPTVVACSGTAASVAWSKGTGIFEFDVGTSCAGESTATITFGTTATNGWLCHCTNQTTAARNVLNLSGSGTTAVISQFAFVTDVAQDFADGDNVRCTCEGD
jgi:hypothetical protein